MPHARQAQRTAIRASAVRPANGRTAALRALGAGAALLLAAGSLSACSGSSADALPAPDQSNIKVGVVDSIGDVPFLIGATSGSQNGNSAFSKAGLTVTVQTFDDESDEITALNNGSIDIAYGEYGQFLAENDPLAKAGDLRVLADAYDAGPGSIELLVRQGASTPNFAAIFHHSSGAPVIAVPTDTGPEFLSLADYFNSQNMPISSPIGTGGTTDLTGSPDIQVQADPTKIIQGVADGQYAAAALQEPYATMAEEQDGLVPALNLATGDSAGVPLDGYFASSSFVSKFPNTAEVFSQVQAKLQAIGASRVTIEAAILQGMTNPSQAVQEYVATMQLGTYPTATVPEKISIDSDLMYNAGTISSQLPISSIVYAAS
jgi:NitT/TauT family transport system substrate-binding protein